MQALCSVPVRGSGHAGPLREDCPLTSPPLSPPLHARPVYWMYDHALRLYPQPDLVVIGDKSDPFTVTSNECTITNPGSFHKTDFEFKVYIPATKMVEDSKIAD